MKPRNVPDYKEKAPTTARPEFREEIATRRLSFSAGNTLIEYCAMQHGKMKAFILPYFFVPDAAATRDGFD